MWPRVNHHSGGSRNDKTLGLVLAMPSIIETRNYFRVKRTVLISRPVTCSSPQRWCRTFLSLSCAVAVLVAELAALPHIAYARAYAPFVALPLVRSQQNHLMVRA